MALLESEGEMGDNHKLLDISPVDQATFLMNYGAVLMEKYGKLEEAKEWYIRALDINSFVELYDNLEEVCQKLGQNEEATKYRKLKNELNSRNKRHSSRKRARDDNYVSSKKRKKRRVSSL